MDLCGDQENRIIFCYNFLVVLNSIGDASLLSLAVILPNNECVLCLEIHNIYFMFYTISL